MVMSSGAGGGDNWCGCGPYIRKLEAENDKLRAVAGVAREFIYFLDNDTDPMSSIHMSSHRMGLRYRLVEALNARGEK